MHNAAFPHGIMFHHFHGEKHPVSQGSISADEFAQVIEHCGVDRFLRAEEWYEKAVAGRLDAQDLCITFDDGLLCQYEVALPVLRQYRLTGFWFVYTSVYTGSVEMIEVYRTFRHQCFDSMDDFYERFFAKIESTPLRDVVRPQLEEFVPGEYLRNCPFYSIEDKRFRFTRDVVLSRAEYNDVMKSMMPDYDFDLGDWVSRLWMREDHLRDLRSRGHIIGLHSHTHPTACARLPVSEQNWEYLANYTTLLRVVGEAPLTVAHPCNSYNEDVLRILRQLGVKVGFSATMELGDAASDLELPREDHANIMRHLRSDVHAPAATPTAVSRIR